jgi:hypothetical protein
MRQRSKLPLGQVQTGSGRANLPDIPTFAP